MRKPNNFFLMGVFTAVFMLAIFSGNSFLKSTFASDWRGTLPRELRLGNEIGIIHNDELQSSKLNRSINAGTFSEKMGIVLDLLGASEASTGKDLTKLGILTGKKASATIMRKEALEIFARAAIYLQDKDMLIIPQVTAKNFSDYRIAEKYSHAVAYLQGKFVVRGYPNGSLGAQKRLSNKEAIFLLYRFYEAVSSDLMRKRTNEGINFIDITLNHPLMESIRNLTAAGAFDKIMLKASFDGESYISISDLMDIISGIVSKANQEVDQIRIKTIFADSGSVISAKRRHLALLMEYLLETFAKDRINAEKINYADVTIEQPEHEALLKIAGCGIKMGSSHDKFAGEDPISWYETTKMLNEILKYVDLIPVAAEKAPKLAQKADIENFKALIRAKREKIHQILNRTN